MITVSPEFSAAQFADVAQFSAQLYLVLGNYAAAGAGATVASSGDDASGDYPAAGAIDSDRTEINVGAAASADNGVGKSSWKANANPSGGAPNTLTITFNAPTNGGARTFNRLKLYNLAADPLTSYLLQYWTGAAWVSFAGTPDRFSGSSSGQGWGQGGFGSGPWGGSPASPGYTGGLDFYDFPDVTSTKIQLLVYATTSGGPAQVVEIEVYRKIDITSRTTDYRIDRKKDLKLANPIATQLDVTLDNTDQFFSLAYSPTAAEVAAGYVNAELAALGFDIEVNEGFYTAQGIERIRTFTGSADSLTDDVGPDAATASISARDYMKHLINQVDSCNLKTSIDIADAIKYLLNRNNVSNYEMNLFTTTITLAYFFAFETQVLTTIQQLVQAAGDSIFFFDESGVAQFQYFLSNTPQSKVIATNADWAAGTLVNIDDASVPTNITRRWFLVDDFADGQLSSNPVWSVQTVGTGSVSVVSNRLVMSPGNASAGASTPCALSTGTWRFIQHAVDNDAEFGFALDGGGTGLAGPTGHGYSLFFNTSGASTVKLCRRDPSRSILATAAVTFAADDEWRVTRDSSGVMNVYQNGTLVLGPITDTTYSSGSYIVFTDTNGGGGSSYSVTDIRVSNAVDPTSSVTNVQAIWTSATIDQGASLLTEGTLEATVSTPPGTSLAFYTRTSSDGVTWGAWALATLGSVIPSATLRYLQIQIVFTCPIDSGTANGNLTAPTVFNVTANWFTGSGQQKWSSNVNFSLAYNNTIERIQLQVSDNLGGDTAVINDVAVTSSPKILAGTATDTVWQAVTGTPPSAVSASNPLAVSVGTLTFNITVPGGMDTSAFGTPNTGSGGGGIAITFAGSATGSAVISYSHPTKPVLTITITHAGTITDLRLVGLTFQNIQTPFQNLASDLASIAAHHRRRLDINNDFIVSGNVGGIIATKVIANFKEPVTWIPKLTIWPKLNMQPGDQVNVTELVTGVAANYYVAGYQRQVRVNRQSADASMDLVLLQVPTS